MVKSGLRRAFAQAVAGWHEEVFAHAGWNVGAVQDDEEIVFEKIKADSIPAKEPPSKAPMHLAVDREKDGGLGRQEVPSLTAFEHNGLHGNVAHSFDMDNAAIGKAIFEKTGAV